MVISIGINGFSRIGRVVFRTCLQNSNVKVSAINDPVVAIEYICYLIKYDSTHGNLKVNISCADNIIYLDDNKIKVFSKNNPSSIPWGKAGVQYVVEASGMCASLEKVRGHLRSTSVKRVLVTAPSRGTADLPMLILGVNNNSIHFDDNVIYCGSSTLYCLAPIIKLLEENFGIEDGIVTCIHAMTPSLKPLDGLCSKSKYWRENRSITQNIIPAPTGACKALERIIPKVRNKLTGLAFKVPVVNVSLLDINIRLRKNTTLEDIAIIVEIASKLQMKNIIGVSRDLTVSSDYDKDTRSCILDLLTSMQLKPNYFKLICWHENEVSYASRVIDSILFCETLKSVTDNQSKLSNTHNICKTTSAAKSIKKKSQDILTIHESQVKTDSNLSIRNDSCLTSNFNIHSNDDSMIIWKEDHTASKPVMSQNTEFLSHNKSCTKAASNNVQALIDKVKHTIFNNVSDGQGLSTSAPNGKSLYTCHQEIRALEKAKDIVGHSDNTTKELYENEIEKNQSVNTEIKNVLDNAKQQQSFEIPQTKINFKQNVSNTLASLLDKISRNFHIPRFVEQLRLPQNTEPCQQSEIGQHKITGVNCEKDTTVKSSSKAIKNLIFDCKSSYQLTRTHECCSIHKVKPHTNEYVETLASSCGSQVKIEQSIDSVIALHMLYKNLEMLNTVNSKIDTIENKNESPKLHQKVYNTFKDQSKTGVIQEDFDEKKEYFDHKTTNKILGNLSTEHKDKTETLVGALDNIQCKNILDPTSIKEKFSHTKDDQNEEASELLNNTKMDNAKENSHTNCEICEMDCSRTDAELFKSNFEEKTLKQETQDLYDKLESVASSSDSSDYSLQRRKSQILQLSDIASLEDLDRLEKICRIIEISDELSDKLFSNVEKDVDDNSRRNWSFQVLCEKMNLDEFCNNIFGNSTF